MPVHRHPLALASILRNVPSDEELAQRLERSAVLFGSPPGAMTARFYERLFLRMPALRSMFPADLIAQQGKLAGSIAFVVAHVRSPERLGPTLRELGRRHVAYGAKAHHYPVVVDEMVGAMGDVAGPRWTADDASDWRTALRMVSNEMMAGAAVGEE